MNYQELLDRLGALKDAAKVDRVFGEPLQVGEKTIIPVAEVRTGMGFGFGTNQEAGEAEESNEGGGGGGGLDVRPAGVVEVTPEATTFIPTPRSAPPAVLVLVGFGLGLLWAGRRRRD